MSGPDVRRGRKSAGASAAAADGTLPCLPSAIERQLMCDEVKWSLMFHAHLGRPRGVRGNASEVCRSLLLKKIGRVWLSLTYCQAPCSNYIVRRHAQIGECVVEEATATSVAQLVSMEF